MGKILANIRLLKYNYVCGIIHFTNVIKAAVKVNDEMLRFYFSLGRDISVLLQEAKYASGFYKNVSGDLQDVFPDVHSFSITNLKYMKYFYELYADMKTKAKANMQKQFFMCRKHWKRFFLCRTGSAENEISISDNPKDTTLEE